MFTKNLSSLQLESMTDPPNKDKLFRLIWIQNLCPTNNPFFFGLFKHTAPKGKYLLAKIVPESLSLYAPGAFFFNGYRISIPKAEGEIMDLKICSLARNPLKTVFEAFTDTHYDLRHDNPKYSKEQWCRVFETGSQEIIFPCFVIGAAYYFLSASMRIQLLSQNIEGLYYPGSIKINEQTREASIKLKNNASDEDAADIVRFSTDRNARKHWEDIVNNLRKTRFKQSKPEQFVSMPFIADFPTAEELEIKARVKRFKDPSSGKEKILVLEMLEENSSLQFDYLTIYRDDKEPRRIDVTKRARAVRTSNTVTRRIPTTELAAAVIENTHLVINPNKEEMIVIKEYVEGGDKEMISVPVVTGGVGSADLSLASAERDGDPDVRHGSVRGVPTEEKKEEDEKEEEKDEKEVRVKDCFTLQDFQEMVALLTAENAEVHNLQIHGPYLMPVNATSGTKGTLKEYYDKKHTRRRMFLYVTFAYEGKDACIIEIDQNGLPGGSSTYVLVSDAGNYTYTKELVEGMLKLYVSNKTIKSIEANFSEKGLRFVHKKHPAGKGERDYKAWRERLLERIKE